MSVYRGAVRHIVQTHKQTTKFNTNTFRFSSRALELQLVDAKVSDSIKKEEEEREEEEREKASALNAIN